MVVTEIAGRLVEFGKRSFETAAALGDAAERAGVAVESLSRLRLVAEQSNVEFGSLTVAIKSWQLLLSRASSGQQDAADSLNLLRLNASQLKSLRLEDQLKVIADQFSRIRDPADQTRVAVELFGRAGEQLVPLLNKGGAAIADLSAEADRLGITLDQNTVSAVNRADNALKRFLATIGGAGQRAAGNIALAIMGPKDEIEAASIEIDKLLEQRKMLEESAKSAGPDAPAWFRRINSNAMAKVNQELERANQNLLALQKTAAANGPAPLEIPKEPEKISEVLITQRKAELQGLAKLLDQFEQDTKSSEDKIYQDYLDTTNKIKELQKAGIIDAAEAAKRISNAQIKFENDVLIDPVKITQSKVIIQQTLTEQQRAVDKFVDTLSTGLENLARSGELTGRSILKYLLSAFEAQVLKDAIAGLGNYLKKSLGGTGSTGSSALGSFIGGIFGAFGHAAGGGSMSGPRIVGEDGPELALGGGSILNRRQLAFAMGGGGGAGVNYAPTTVVNINGSDNAAQTAQYVEARIQANNRKQLEQMDRLLKNNYGRGLR